jgi:hypothetical protein
MHSWLKLHYAPFPLFIPWWMIQSLLMETTDDDKGMPNVIRLWTRRIDNGKENKLYPCLLAHVSANNLTGSSTKKIEQVDTLSAV